MGLERVINGTKRFIAGSALGFSLFAYSCGDIVVPSNDTYVPDTSADTTPVCIDEDGDNYGINCNLGNDCDDGNVSLNLKINCNYDGNECGDYQLCAEECPTPPEEICDGIDNNCNGSLDGNDLCDCGGEYYPVEEKCCNTGLNGGMLCVVDWFYSPGSSPTGLTHDGENLWVADEGDDKIYRIKTTGEVISSFNSPEKSSWGLTWDGENLWNVGYSLIHGLTTSGEVISSFDPPSGSPAGLAWDGKYLWNSDWGTLGAYKLTKAGQILDSFAYPGDIPTGLTWNDKHLWSADLDGKIYKFTQTGQFLNSFDSPENDPWGLTWDGKHLLLADRYEHRIYILEYTE